MLIIIRSPLSCLFPLCNKWNVLSKFLDAYLLFFSSVSSCQEIRKVLKVVVAESSVSDRTQLWKPFCGPFALLNAGSWSNVCLKQRCLFRYFLLFGCFAFYNLSELRKRFIGRVTRLTVTFIFFKKKGLYWHCFFIF